MYPARPTRPPAASAALNQHVSVPSSYTKRVHTSLYGLRARGARVDGVAGVQAYYGLARACGGLELTGWRGFRPMGWPVKRMGGALELMGYADMMVRSTGRVEL